MTNIISISERITKYALIFVLLLFVLPLVSLFFVGRYIGFTTSSYGPSLDLLFSLVVGLPALLVWIFFSNAVTYWLICSGVILLAFISFYRGNCIGSNKFLALILMISIPLGMIVPYAPAVQPSSGNLMVSATQPILFERGLKNLQVWGEVTPCVYSLSGWDRQRLFYKETCGNTVKRFQFDPSTLNKSSSIGDAPILLIQKIPHADVLKRFQAVNVKPTAEEFSVRSLSIKGDALSSPDGEWVAIIARHIYGPEDVVLVRVQPGQTK